jgi:hypothetical protein
MEYVRMQTKKLIIDGDHFEVVFYNQDDGTIRVELSHNVTGKHYKMYPDNIIQLKESSDE